MSTQTSLLLLSTAMLLAVILFLDRQQTRAFILGAASVVFIVNVFWLVKRAGDHLGR